MSAGSATHQTIRLGRGRHSSPSEGACLMELASMLAGEAFSDHPTSVCPVIGSLLRAYNDTVDDDRRQDLYAYASAAVGTNGSQAACSARAARVADWTDDRHRRRGLLSRLSKGLQRISFNHLPEAERGGTLAVLAIGRHTSRTHDEVLALIRDLVEISSSRPTADDVETAACPPTRRSHRAPPVASP